MAKSHSLEDRLAALKALRLAPRSPEALAQFKSALASKTNLLAVRAAEIAGEFELADLAPDLAAALIRFIELGAQADKGSLATTAIAKTLYRLGSAAAEPAFLRGVRHEQPEATFSGPVDTAAELRGICAQGLVWLRHRDGLFEAVRLLVDPWPLARLGAVQAICSAGRAEGVLVLRHKALIGDLVPDVTGECFTGLIRLDAERSVPFVAGFLNGPDPSVAEYAALALGESRRPEVFAILREQWERLTDAESRRVMLLAMALLRAEPAVAFLTSLVAKGDRSASQAIAALAIYKQDEAIRARIEAALASHNSPPLRAAFEKEFGPHSAGG